MINKKLINIMKTTFIILFFVEGYLQTSCYTFGNKIISFVIWPMTLLGIILLIYNMSKYKEFLKDKKNWLLIIFSFSFLISTIVMRKYGIYKNIRIFAFLLFQFFILYLYNKEDDHESKLKIYLNIFLVGTFILSWISMLHLITGYSKYTINNNSPHLVYGFTWGRLFGAYWDPNIAAVICSISLIIIIDMIRNAPKRFSKILLILFGIMQVLYVVFSDSRTGRICLIMAITSYVVFNFIKLILNGEYKKINKFFVKMAASIIIALALTVVVPEGVKYAYNQLPLQTTTEKVTINKKLKIKEIKKTKKGNKIGRGYDLENDISNKRFDIWNSGISIFKRNIFVGVSRTNIVPYALKVMPKTFIVHNTQMHFSSMHNLYVDILVSQGLLGIIPFMLFMILSAINILKNLKKLFLSSKYTVMFLSIIMTLIMATMVMTEIIYVDSPNSTLFWICLGYLNYLCLKKEED